MKGQDIIDWASNVIARVFAGQPTEDSRIELKAAWPDVKQAARRLAGHANASYGGSVLWLIGVDQNAKTVSGADNKELANWYPQLQKEFDGHVAPHLIADVNLSAEGNPVVALLFDTSNAPYVIKVPGSDRLEAPWREGTRTRSATRSELLRLSALIQGQGHVPPLRDFANETHRAQRLALEKPTFWEYLLTIELLRSKFTEVRRSYSDLEKGFIFRKSKVISGRECYNFLLGKMRDMEQLIPAFDAVLNNEIPASWGAPGEAGDATEIKHAVDILINACNELVEWEVDIRSVQPPEVFDRLLSLMRGLTATFLDEVERLIEELSRPFEQPNPRGEYDINLVLKFPENRIEQMTAELHRVGKHFREEPEEWE
jgi:hypothetical protein